MGLKVEQSDLEMEVNFALVCRGKMCDFIKIREYVRTNFPDVDMIFKTASGEYLFIMKKSKLTPEQLKAFEKDGAKSGKR